MEDLRTNRKYEYLNTYLQDKIFMDEAEEVKLGYLNINALKNKVEDIDEDKNLLYLDYLILSETKLAKDMKINFKNWNVSRFDFEDKSAKLPHMGMAFLSNKKSTQNIEPSKACSINMSGKTKFQYVPVNLTNYELKGIFFWIKGVWSNIVITNNNIGRVSNNRNKK